METAEILKALLTFVLGAASSWLGLYWKVRKDLEARYDRELRAERVIAYKSLWKLMQPIAQYSRPEPVSPASLERFSGALRQWYFETGGLFMSTATQSAYVTLQKVLREKIAAGKEHPEAPLLDRDFKDVYQKGSALRTATTIDVGSRKKSLVDD